MVPAFGVVVVLGVVGEAVVLDVGEVVVPDGVVGVAPPPAAAATVTASFIPPLQWPGTPQMK